MSVSVTTFQSIVYERCIRFTTIHPGAIYSCRGKIVGGVFLCVRFFEGFHGQASLSVDSSPPLETTIYISRCN